jgi:hypothetical protein
MEEPTVFYLGEEALKPNNSPITNLSVPILIQVFPPKETPSERQLVLRETMEENDATSSGSARNPVMTTTAGGILPPLPPSLLMTTMVLTPSTLGIGPILLSDSTTFPST